MKILKTTKIILKIILLFIVAIFLHKIGDNFSSFFNDTICDGTILNKETKQIEYFEHYTTIHYDVVVHWGYRHWLYFTMGVCLTVVQTDDIIDDFIE